MKPVLLYYNILNFRDYNLEIIDRYFNRRTLEDPSELTDEALEDVEVLFAPLGFFCGEELISKAKSLKVIASNTTGIPHIDAEAAKKAGVYVASLAGQTAFLETITPTAEHTWGLMLAVIRHTPWAFQSVLEGKWSRWPFGAPKMLSRMSLGIVGMGRLGKIVVKYAKAFGMSSVFYDPYVDQAPLKSCKKVDKLEDLLKCSEVVSLHVPLNDETENMIDSAMFEHFQQGSYLINTARGAVVNTKAMLKALNSGKLLGVGLDVMDDEFERDFDKGVGEHPLIEYAKTHDNLLITPHIAGSTVDAWSRTQEYTIYMALNHLALAEFPDDFPRPLEVKP